MKLLYATSLSYPAPYASRIQALATAEALGRALGDQFAFSAAHIGAIGLPKYSRIELGVGNGPLLAWRTLSYAKREGFDAIYCREPGFLYWLMLIAYARGAAPKFFFEAHGADTEWWSRFSYVVPRSEHVFCLTKLLAEKLEQEYGARSTSVLPDGVDVAFFSESRDTSAFRDTYSLPREARLVSYIGSVGLHDWKGVDVLLAAQPLVSTPARFVVAGVPEAALAEWRARYPAVAFLPWLSRADAATLMQSSVALVLPNKPGTAVSERFTSPMKLFEYMASGTPLIASDLPSIREVVDEHTALLVAAGDPAALARGIQGTLADPSGAHVRAIRAQQESKRYSWDARADEILEQFRPHWPPENH